MLHLKKNPAPWGEGVITTANLRALTCCCLWVLWVLDWAGSWMARRASMLWSTLLCLACRRGRGLRVLRVRVQGGTRVGVLLRHWPWRH